MAPQNALLGVQRAMALQHITPFEKVMYQLRPTLNRWGNGYLLRVLPSGSYVKGTAVAGGSDVDLFCSISSNVPNTLEQAYSTLGNALKAAGYSIKVQNVSIGISVLGLKVDVTPGIRRDAQGNDHSLYSTKARSWIKTDINKQINFVRNSGRLEEIRWLKRWRNDRGIVWPSYHLELTTIKCLKGSSTSRTARNITQVLGCLTDASQFTVLTDPANSNNNVASTMTFLERQILANAAWRELQFLA